MMPLPNTYSKKSKRSVIMVIKGSPDQLKDFLNNLLAPVKDINDLDTIDWCRWLMAGGQTPEEFASEVKLYDNATTCGLVWTANFVAYRCRTCGISPCMSLCAECFHRGNHEGHDFNMFKSQAGGACDCGDTNVMKESGFCGRHGPQAQEPKPSAPDDLMCLPNTIMPRLIFRLIQHLRDNSASPIAVTSDADAFLSMLQEFSLMGAAMRRVMTRALTDPQVYKDLTEWSHWSDPDFLLSSAQVYEQALKTLLNPEPPEEYKDCPSLQEQLVHRTFLEELMFWTVKFEFPQKVVCLLLNLLPDPEYKEPLTRAFVLHYSRIPMMLERSRSPETLSNRVVHVSVQLFSNEKLALKMTTELSLLHVMVVSLKYMMEKILIPNTLHDPRHNLHLVVDCGQQVMKEHCYWPLVSDLNNVLSHKPVALKFMSDDNLLEMWFAFLSMFQGMNVNQRELVQHIEFEPSTYYAAFSAELEASAYPMWALVSHLKDESTLHLTRSVLNSCITALQDWFDAIHFTEPTQNDHKQVSFHLPLHRYLAVLMSQAVKCQGVTLKQILPPPDILQLVYYHPLMLQVAFYEILNGMWVRNGLQIRGQMMTYVQCNFCNSMVDADLYLLQVCATQIDPEKFLMNVLKMFRVTSALSIAPSYQNANTSYFDFPFELHMLESCFIFLATLIDIRSNLGVSDSWVSKLEMVTLLCMGDKTHSQLMELMPERCGSNQNKEFDDMLAEVADYRAPTNMQQGMYGPKPHVWEELYDPIHVLLRAVQRRDFQTSMDRFTEYVQQTKKLKHGSGNVWPPLRVPAPCGDPYEDPRKLLQSRIFHAMVFCILYKAVDRQNVSEHILALALYMLEMAVLSSPPTCESELCQTDMNCHRYEVRDNDLTSFYEQDWLSQNLRTVIHNLIFIHEVPEQDGDSKFFKADEDLETTENQDIEIDMETGTETGLPALDLVVFEEASSSNASTPVLSNSIHLPSTSQGSNNTQLVLAGQASTSSSMQSIQSGSEAWPLVCHPLEVATESSNEVVPSTSNSVHSNSLYKMIMPSDTRMSSEETLTKHLKMLVNESIISLLLKLHAQLSGSPDSYVMGRQAAEGMLDSRIGDGPFFVAKVLDRIALLDERCRECIKVTKEKLWPKRPEEDGSEAKAREAREREERRRKAKERQQKLMAEFASMQKQFMEKAMETEECENEDWNEESAAQIKSEYDCVICNQTTPSTQDKPMGLVVLLQPSSVLGHKRKSNSDEVLPTSDEEMRVFLRDDTLANDFDKKITDFSREFDESSWLLSISLGWEGGVHVQTCGHHLHMDCLKAYLQSLRGQQRQQSLAVDRGEYACPICRQLANSVLPLAPELGEITSVVRARPQTLANQISSITSLLKNYISEPESSNLSEAMGKSMEDMTNCTLMRFQRKTESPSPQSLFLFVSSIARTNLEMEIVQRGGSFLTKPTDATLTPKRSCIVPLLHMLAIHGRILAQWPIWQTWQQLAQFPEEESETQIANIEKEVPLLLRDPITLLIQLLLFLPINLDQSYFSCIVKCLYNLLYFQVLSQISVNMTENERASWRDSSDYCGEIRTLDVGLNYVIRQLEGSLLYVDSSGNSSSEGNSYSNRQSVENKVESLCLPYLRIAALLRHHLFNEEIPEVRTEQTEFVRLVYYLELVTEGMDWSKFNAAVGLNFTEPGLSIPTMWFRQLSAYTERSQRAARTFLSKLHITWYPPKLLNLPKLYDRIFQYYHKRQCAHCNSVPREASVCLLCGTLVCLKEPCCKDSNMCEAVQHSIDCGAGTAMFLVVPSSYIVVIRGKRACLWGSVYLDSFGEEDKELKRGKPLYLCQERYQHLQEQWLTHRFDHTHKKWVWHRDNL